MFIVFGVWRIVYLRSTAHILISLAAREAVPMRIWYYFNIEVKLVSFVLVKCKNHPVLNLFEKRSVGSHLYYTRKQIDDYAKDGGQEKVCPSSSFSHDLLRRELSCLVRYHAHIYIFA